MNSEEREKKAKQRFITLNAIRFSGVFLVFLGIANIGGKFLPEFAPVLGGLFMLLGMIEFFFMPILMKIIWDRQGIR
ncbi:MAG: hypothetical protein IPM67_05600 [Sphingomonadales bacterium]|jgi:hypothetical protein|nr:hypothetical protein [Sphingomonadales bacterium]MBK9268121.1 hypothetical protein [Sphingomonadales bacterium]MBP6433642.1 hypothetical protein [Sphingorhabdus sp.]